MKKLLVLPFLLVFSQEPVSAQELYRININKACAAIVGIPYASDNFSDKEWEQFKQCLQFMRYYQE